MSESNKLYITYAHITLGLNLTGRSKRSTYQIRVQDSLKWKQSNLKPYHPKNLILMKRNMRTQFQPFLYPNLNSTRSLGRSKLTKYEFLIDQNRDKRTECIPARIPRIAHKETNNRVSLSIELFLVSQEDQRTANPSQHIYTLKF